MPARNLGEWEGKYDIERIKMTGFLAQEVEQAALLSGYDFSGIQNRKILKTYIHSATPISSCPREGRAGIECTKSNATNAIERPAASH